MNQENTDLINRKVKGRLYRVAANFFPIWVIAFVAMLLLNANPPLWARIASTAVLAILVAKSSFPNIGLIAALDKLYGGTSVAIKNNLFIAWLGLAGMVYAIAGIWMDLPLSKYGFVTGLGAAILSSVQGKKDVTQE